MLLRQSLPRSLLVPSPHLLLLLMWYPHLHRPPPRNVRVQQNQFVTLLVVTSMFRRCAHACLLLPDEPTVQLLPLALWTLQHHRAVAMAH